MNRMPTTVEEWKTFIKDEWTELEATEKGGKMQSTEYYNQGAAGLGGLGGFGGIGLFGILGLLGIDGLNGNKGGDAMTYQQGVIDGTTAKYSDVVAAVNNIDQNLNSGFDRIANVSRTGSETVLASLADAKDTVQAGILQQALFAKDFQISQCAQTTALLDATREEGDKTRALITENVIQDLRDSKAALMDELSDWRHGFAPITRSGRFVQDGDGIDVNIINQNVSAIGSAVAQNAEITKVLASEIAALKSAVS